MERKSLREKQKECVNRIWGDDIKNMVMSLGTKNMKGRKRLREEKVGSRITL